MSILPVRSTVTPSPCRMATTLGNAAPPWDTKYTGPVRAVARIGVVAVAVPKLESAGHDAGFAANAVSVHAFWIVGMRRAGSSLGSVTATLWVFACPSPLVYFTSRLAPLALLLFAWVETVNEGLNARFA